MQSDCAVIVTRQQIPSLYTFTVPLACKVKKTVKMPYTVCPLFIIKISSRMQTTVPYRKIIVHVPSEIYFTHAVVYITFDSVHFNLDEPAEPPSIMFIVYLPEKFSLLSMAACLSLVKTAILFANKKTKILSCLNKIINKMLTFKKDRRCAQNRVGDPWQFSGILTAYRSDLNLVESVKNRCLFFFYK